MCQLRASRYQRDDKFGLMKILQIDLNVKCFELIKHCIIVWDENCKFQYFATLDMKELMVWKCYRSFFFEVSWILVLVMTFEKTADLENAMVFVFAFVSS